MVATFRFNAASESVNSLIAIKELFNSDEAVNNDLPTFATWWMELKTTNNLRVATINGLTGVRLLDYNNHIAKLIGKPYLKKKDILTTTQNTQEHYIKLSLIKTKAIKKGLCK